MLAHTVLLLGPFHGRVEDCGRQNGQKEPVFEKFHLRISELLFFQIIFPETCILRHWLQEDSKEDLDPPTFGDLVRSWDLSHSGLTLVWP